MLLRRTISLLGTLSLVMAVGLPGMAQDLEGLQLFAPVEVNPYGPGPQPNEGFFFAWDGLNWYISKPEIATVGREGLSRTVSYGIHPINGADPLNDMAVQSNTLDTSSLQSLPTSGDRFEFGRIHGHHGWMVSTYHLKPQTQWIYAADVPMTFNDISGNNLLQGIVGTIPAIEADPDAEPPVVGVDEQIFVNNLPLTFDDVRIRNSVTTWSVELMYIFRSHQFHHGGFVEIFGGVRYMEFDEVFDVDARGTDPAVKDVPAILADSVWNTRADNHITGPQVGIRWFRKGGRWMFSTEGRFFAGFNSQTIRQFGVLGDKLDPPGEDNFEPTAMGPTYFNSMQHIDEWSPCAELRAELRFQCTRSVSLRAGWTGVWMGGIARPSDMINYEVPAMGISAINNRQDVFVNGLTLGVDINR